MTINCNGSLINLSTPKVMGILNLTPDSFYDGGKYKNENEILKQTELMLKDGATFIDIGAYSSRPGADHISIEEEKKRILPIVSLLLDKFPEILVSIDTFRSEIAKLCIETGATLINDISSGDLDDKMLPTIGELKVPYIMMHMKGTPKTMKTLDQYDKLIIEINTFFAKKVADAKKCGINDIIIDPGFGFAKNTLQNFEILKYLILLESHNLPILAGLSRKSMVYKILNNTPQEALNGTTALNTIALLNGASILRVHDVKEAMECITLVNTYNQVD
ncbi:dihydropteroate synthase [Aquimarina muelleri]|uniref:Dihydropteroate synthase n=1 Tax=Aquimarina muelleri TaxID=279356 RepID=A0A918JYR7_9FLAO|nr:dihydropteroate synthase [Aquimarina muelleri]MCX2763875.1 dihydropteroate synthase [Aquimarina muelleri]GGX29141.1 dihydropteroate synthase [Aquimarina muelleri]